MALDAVSVVDRALKVAARDYPDAIQYVPLVLSQAVVMALEEAGWWLVPPPVDEAGRIR